jgi:hypothetical protein
VRRLLALLFAALPVALAPAAPVPKHLMKERSPYYYATAVGATFDYGQGPLVVEKVEEVKGVKGARDVTVTSGKGAVHEVMRVSEGGLARVGFGAPFDTPLVFLQPPVRVGTTWEIKTSGAQGTGTITALEELKIPAGTFDAVRVDIVQPQGGGSRTLQVWYARDVGMLRMTENGKDIWLLKSFKPGK